MGGVFFSHTMDTEKSSMSLILSKGNDILALCFAYGKPHVKHTTANGKLYMQHILNDDKTCINICCPMKGNVWAASRSLAPCNVQHKFMKSSKRVHWEVCVNLYTSLHTFFNGQEKEIQCRDCIDKAEGYIEIGSVSHFIYKR